jgi:iron(III) transport system permease protein
VSGLVATRAAGRAVGRPRRPGRPARWLPPLAALVAACFGAPLAYLAVRNLEQPAAMARALGQGALGPAGRSLLLGATVAAATAALGTALAWLVTRTDLPGSGVLKVVLPLPLVIPSFIGAFALIAAFAPGGLLAGPLRSLGVEPPRVGGYWAAFAVLTLFTYPYVYLPVAARLRQLPASLEESARLLGRRPLAVFWLVVRPQLTGAIAAGALLAALYAISDFGAVQLLRYDTLPRAIYSGRLLDQAGSLALSLLLALGALAVVAGERRLTRRARALRGAREGRPLLVRLGAWKAPALAFVLLSLGASLVAPVGVLAYWAGRGIAEGSRRASAIATDPAQLGLPAVNTAWVSVLAAAAATVTVLPVAYLTTRYRGRLGGAANAIVVAGFALPGLVLALAMVYWLRQAPDLIGDAIYQTHGLLVFAYAVHFGSQALRAAQVAIASVPERVGDAARMLGAGGARRLLRIDLPLMLPGLLAGAGLVLLSAMKELPATLLLAPPGFQTLATKIWTSTEDAFFADASIASLLLVAISAVLTWLLVVRRSHALD